MKPPRYGYQDRFTLPWWAMLALASAVIAGICSLLTGCMAYRETGSSVTLMTLGTNAQTMSAGKLSMTSVNQSDSVKHGTDAAVTVTKLRGWFGLGNTALRETSDITKQLSD